MEVLFLGTGAADWPAEASACEGTTFRRFSSLLIDGQLLIDPGPRVPDALETFRVDASAIRYVLNTHPHADHYCEAVMESLQDKGAQFIPLQAGDTVCLGGYTVQAFRANHAIKTVHLLITDGRSRLYYALDGAWLQYEEAQLLRTAPVDLLVLDGTVGWQEDDPRVFEHNNLRMVVDMKRSLQPYVGRFFITHMAYTLHGDHEELVEQMKPYGIDVACDGLQLKI